MNLRDFVRETLVSIAQGIDEAKSQTRDLLAISPNRIDGKSTSERSYIEFDVAVTVNEKTEAENKGSGGAKAEIEILGSRIGGELSGGVDRKNESSTTNASRVAFKVPVYMSAKMLPLKPE